MVATAERRDIPYYLTGLGSVTAYYTVSVKSRIDGEMMQENFKEGQNVKKGDLLALIDPRPYQVALDQAQATQFKDQAALRDAQLNYERYKQLLQESGAMSQQQVDTQQATANQFEGAVRNDQAAIDSAKLNLVYCHITAPVSGRIGLRQVDPGNIVHANDPNAMFVITQLQPISVIFTIAEDQLPTVYAKQRAGQKLPVDAFDREMKAKLASGTLTTIDNEIDQTTGTVKLRATFDNSHNELFPNQFVNARLLQQEKRGVVLVPSAAVQRNSQSTYVYVVKPDSTVTVRQVKVGTSDDNNTEIASGIVQGDVVVLTGVDKLVEGSKVTVHLEGTPVASTPAASSTSKTGKAGKRSK